MNVAHYSARRLEPTFKRVTRIITAGRSDSTVKLIFTDGTHHRAPVGARVNVRA